MAANKIIGVGHCMVDYFGLLPRYPDIAGTAEIAEFSQQSGGAATTALATLAIFGVETRFVGKTSDDHFGRHIRAGLDGLGVDTSLVVIEPDKVTPFTFSAVEMVEGRRTVFWSRGNVSPLDADDVDIEAALSDTKALLCDGTQPQLQVELARAAQAKEIPVVVDAGAGRPGIEALIRCSDTLVISERIALEVAPASELDQSLRGLQKLGPARCVITLGAEGAIGIDQQGEVHEEPAFRVDVKDTTGAGDVFLGAFTYALAKDWALAKAMRFASIAAGLTCKKLGARAGIPRLEEVLGLLDEA
jgi:sugar/nucleoside kinase (ribokinase family)